MIYGDVKVDVMPDTVQKMADPALKLIMTVLLVNHVENKIDVAAWDRESAAAFFRKPYCPV